MPFKHNAVSPRLADALVMKRYGAHPLPPSIGGRGASTNRDRLGCRPRQLVGTAALSFQDVGKQ